MYLKPRYLLRSSLQRFKIGIYRQTLNLYFLDYLFLHFHGIRVLGSSGFPLFSDYIHGKDRKPDFQGFLHSFFFFFTFRALKIICIFLIFQFIFLACVYHFCYGNMPSSFFLCIAFICGIFVVELIFPLFTSRKSLISLSLSPQVIFIIHFFYNFSL